jgi:hypothetical protein
VSVSVSIKSPSLLKANALATANNNSLHTTIREEPQGNSEAQYVIPNFTQTDSETEQVDFVKHEENSMPSRHQVSGSTVDDGSLT